jgi:hypothetical protein
MVERFWNAETQLPASRMLHWCHGQWLHQFSHLQSHRQPQILSRYTRTFPSQVTRVSNCCSVYGLHRRFLPSAMAIRQVRPSRRNYLWQHWYDSWLYGTDILYKVRSIPWHAYTRWILQHLQHDLILGSTCRTCASTPKSCCWCALQHLLFHRLDHCRLGILRSFENTGLMVVEVTRCYPAVLVTGTTEFDNILSRVTQVACTTWKAGEGQIYHDKISCQRSRRR